MFHNIDVSALDKHEILEIIFPVAYSPLYRESSQLGTSDTATHFIEVEPGIKIGCNLFAANKHFPSILYFHGNGETILDLDWLAPSYNHRGINLFVADYRGYGISDSAPTVSNLIQDSHAIFQSFKRILRDEGYNPKIFVMGRSLGSIPAVEIAYHYQDEVRGLIIESGSAGNFRALWNNLKAAEIQSLIQSKFMNQDKIRAVRIPTLIVVTISSVYKPDN